MSTHGGGNRQRGGNTEGGARAGGVRLQVRPDGSLSDAIGGTHITPEAHAALTALVGRELTTDEIRGMVGAPRDAQVSVTRDPSYELGSGDQVVRFELRGPAVVPVTPYGFDEPIHVHAYGDTGGDFASRLFYRDGHGALHMTNSTFRVHPDAQGQGIGLRIFAHEAANLSRLGVAHIGALMAGWRGSSDQGYQVWPHFGYNTEPGALSHYYKSFIGDKSVPKAARDAIRRVGRDFTILDLYSQGPEAQAWWREHGSAVAGHFDLRPGSRSMETLREYAASKGVQVT